MKPDPVSAEEIIISFIIFLYLYVYISKSFIYSLLPEIFDLFLSNISILAASPPVVVIVTAGSRNDLNFP